MTGYTRQSAATIVAGADIDAGPLADEFDALQSAFGAVTGHAHDGSTGNGPRINLTTSVSGILPAANGGTGLASIASFVTLTGAEVLTNKTLTSPTLQGTVAGSPTFSGTLTMTRPVVTLQDTLTTFQDDGDNTKQMRFDLSAITTATTRTLSLPNATTTLVGTDVTQTLTNKTITAPAMSGTWTGSPTLSGNPSFTGLPNFARGSSTSNQSFWEAVPTDYGAGKPRIGLQKNTTATTWSFTLYDTVDSTGTIGFNCTALVWNGVQIVTTTDTQTLTDKTLTSPIINSGTIAGTIASTATITGTSHIFRPTTAVNMGVELGQTTGGSSTSTFIDFHTGTVATDYDTRIIASGGTGSDGGGTLNIIAGTFTHGGVAVVTTTGTQTLTNKTLTSPTINSGTLASGALSGTFSGTPTFSGNVAFSGAPTVTTAAADDSSTKIASTAYVQGEIAEFAWVKIGSTTVSGAASATITNIPTSGYSKFILIANDLTTNEASGFSSMDFQYSTDNGATYDTVSGDYTIVNGADVDDAANFRVPGNTSTFKHGYVEIHMRGFGVAARSTVTTVVENFYATASAGASTFWVGIGGTGVTTYRKTAEAENAIRVLPATAAVTMTGTITLYGVKS